MPAFLLKGNMVQSRTFAVERRIGKPLPTVYTIASWENGVAVQGIQDQ
ncbi:hypothetical protein [Polycladomyces subterraneus]|uniref:Uncharacterized protein n=1 Tax=Polycladomyces subterraneus TaxID=1016997 RepID=A0ABT8IPQ5_9BACL|nr:hypothetical protein [Polycladomyces subterraneus]MDN4594732.1 hypothetical protein [Polycladomyces subterraneus]